MPYKTIAEAKKEGFPTTAEGIDLTISQINDLASIYDSVKQDSKVKNPMAVAWKVWKKKYEIKNNKWVKMKKASEKKQIQFFYPIELKKFSEGEDNDTSEIQVIPTGKWKHPYYGPIVIEASDITKFKENFDKSLRNDIPITEGHEVMDEKPAIGWFSEVIDRGEDGLYAVIEWTKKGKTLLSEKAYKYFSPEFYTEYEDPESREIYTNVLVGGALTNKPYFKELDAVVLSEKILNNNKLNFMEIKEVAAKKLEDLTDEEKAFLVENKSELTDEQKETYATILVEEETKPEEKEEEKKEEKPEEKPEENKEDGGDKKVEASEVKISMSEYEALKNKANAGFEASEKLRKMELSTEVDKMVYSETNQAGKILPKNRESLLAFMETLSVEQRKSFSEILEGISTKQIFNEIGKGGNSKGTAVAAFETQVKKLMSEDSSLKYSDAAKMVAASDKGLLDGYQKELKG